MDEVASSLKYPMDQIRILGEEKHIGQQFAPRIGNGHRLDAILPQVLAETERAVRGLSAEEVVQLRGLLARMAENLKL